METKWTPGPWQMETVRTSCGTCHRIGPFPRPGYASKSEGWACVYDDYPPGKGSPDLLANAHLIAAAPDLYAALDMQVRNCPLCKGTGKSVDVFMWLMTAGDAEKPEPTDCRWCSDGRAALAKARGEAK